MPSDKPMTFDEFKKNPKLCAALMAYMTKSYTIENFKFYYDKGNAAAIYPKYISDKAKFQVNIKSATKKLADQFSNDFDNKIWDKIIAQAKKEVHQMCIADTFPNFYTSKQYEEYCKKEKMGDPKKAAKLLGISNIKLLTQAMEAGAIGDKKNAITHLTKLAKEEKMKEKAEVLYKNLEKAGLI